MLLKSQGFDDIQFKLSDLSEFSVEVKMWCLILQFYANINYLVVQKAFSLNNLIGKEYIRLKQTIIKLINRKTNQNSITRCLVMCIKQD